MLGAGVRLVTMSKIRIVYLILLSLSAPHNAGAAAWMSLSMSEHGDSRAMQGGMASNAYHATARGTNIHSYHNDQSESAAHPRGPQDVEHNKQDCESECLSCANHCSSLALLSNYCESQSKNRVNTPSLTHPLSRFAEPLLRPPILA